MEPTTKASGAKWIWPVVAIIVILLIVMFASKQKTEAPVENTPTVSGENMSNSELEAEIEASMKLEDEAFMSEIDKEFE